MILSGILFFASSLRDYMGAIDSAAWDKGAAGPSLEKRICQKQLHKSKPGIKFLKRHAHFWAGGPT